MKLPVPFATIFYSDKDIGKGSYRMTKLPGISQGLRWATAFAAVGLPLTAPVLAQNTSPLLMPKDAPTLVCYQNGRQIFQVGPLQSMSQAGGEAYLDFQHQDGSRGQVRIVGTAVCLVIVHPPAPSTGK